MSTRRTRADAGWACSWSARICRYCGGPVTAPRRRTFCSEACVHEWRVRSDPGYARLKVLARDHGVCALCGLTTGNWEADHILPVAEGGGECGLDNYRTLCRACHQGVTAELRGRLARRARVERLNSTSGLLMPLGFLDGEDNKEDEPMTTREDR